MSRAAVFDALAVDYDARFTDSALGRLLRPAVWRWLDQAFPPGTHVLELNCGTGEDALHLGRRGVRVLATDVSALMLERASGKIAAAGLDGLVGVRRVALEELERLDVGEPFGGAFSNFGGLNCVADLAALCRPLASLLRPGARLVVCIMGPVVPWEWAWYLARGAPRRAFRRLRRAGAGWRGANVRYPSIAATRRAFAPRFHVRRVGGLGVLLPPTYAAGWLERRPRLAARLDRWERRMESWPIVPWLGDHYLMELERR